MKCTVITLKISRLKLYYKWFSVLHFVTNRKQYFDRKIKIGIAIISLMTVLNSCKNENITKFPFIFNKNKINEVSCYETIFIPENIDTTSETIQVTCYEVVPDPEPVPEMYFKPYELEESPIFAGGMDSLVNFIQSNIVYPEIARQINIKGSVFLEFIITKEGKVEGGTVIRGIEESLDNEALRVVSILPDFVPGKIKGEAVNCYYTVPVKFE